MVVQAVAIAATAATTIVNMPAVDSRIPDKDFRDAPLTAPIVLKLLEIVTPTPLMTVPVPPAFKLAALRLSPKAFTACVGCKIEVPIEANDCLVFAPNCTVLLSNIFTFVKKF